MDEQEQSEQRLYDANDLTAAINQALLQQAVTNQDNDSIRRRMNAFLSGGYDFADTLHNVYLDYGYPAQLNFSNFWNMYRRLGIAKNVVELVPSKAWITNPEIEGLDAEFDKIVEKFNLWQRMKGLDVRQRVGRYAGMFMRVADNKEPDQPIEGKLNGIGSLIDITPLYESQLKVLTTDQDPKSERFGLPTLYQFSSSAEGDRDDKNQFSFNIHPDRLVIASEGADTGNIYGISSLEAGYNSLMDLRKIIGGGGEGFYKNASQQLVFEIEDIANAAKNQKMLDGFSENVDDLHRNKQRRAIMAPGMKTKTLNSDLISPQEFFNVAINDVAASIPMPVTILIGQQTGRLASDEDNDTLAATLQSRRVNFMTEMVKNVIDWFIDNGIIKTAEYTVEWDDLAALSDKDRLTNSKSMAETNLDNFRAGQNAVFTEVEIRTAAGADFADTQAPEPTADETLDDEE